MSDIPRKIKAGGWIGVDLDGTLAEYTHWQGEAHIGKPIKPMLERVKAWIAGGVEVKIFTARVSAGNTNVVIEAILAWCEKNGLPPLAVTCVKDYRMIQLWDDRAVSVEPNTGVAYSPDTAISKVELRERLEQRRELFHDQLRDDIYESSAVRTAMGVLIQELCPDDQA